MAKINKKYLFIVILLVCLFLFTTGYSTWIILNVKDLDESTVYNYREIVTKAYDGQTKEYTGQSLKPDAKYDGDIDLFDSSTYEFFEYKLTDGSNDWISGKPTEVGEYYLHIRNANDLTSEPLQVTFTISPSDELRGYSFTEKSTTIGIGGTCTPSLTPTDLPDGITIKYFVLDGDKETPFELLSTEEANTYTIIAKFINDSNPNYKESGYIVDDSTNIITMQLSIINKILINYYDYDNNLISSEYVDYNGKATPPYSTPAANYMYTYFWSYKDDSDVIVDFDNLIITEDINFQLKRNYREYNVSVFYVDRDNIATKGGYDFITNVSSTYNNTSFEFGATIDNLYKEMKIVLTANYYYLSSVSEFQFTDWQNLSNVTNGGYKEYNNYTLAVTGNNLTIIIHCVQAQAIVHTGALTETTTTIGDPLGTYYANALDAFAACDGTTETKYLRIFGTAKSNKITDNCYMPNETPSVAEYSTTINEYQIKFAKYYIDLSGYTLTSDYTVSSNLHIILPYGCQDTTDIGYLTLQEANSAGGSAIHSVFRISNGVTLTVNGSLTVGSVVKAEGTLSQRAVLMNDGLIVMNNSTKLISYGFIKGSGEIELKSSAEIHDIFKIYDWKGGANSLGANGAEVGIFNTTIGDYFPFNCYSIHNISCVVKIPYGAKYYAWNQLLMGGSWACKENILLVGDGGLFELTDNSGYVERSVEDTTKNTNMNSSYTTNNQDITQRDIYTIYGSFTDNSISVKVSLLGKNVTIPTSKELALPLGFIKLFIMSGNGELTTNSFRCLPGSYIYIAEGATVTIGTGVEIVIYSEYPDNYAYTDSNGTSTNHGYSYYNKHKEWFTSTTVDDSGAQMIIDGKLICNGYIGGRITSTGNGRFITTSNVVEMVELASLTYKSTGSTRTTINKKYFVNGTIDYLDNQNFVTNTNYYFYNGSWHTETGNLIFDLNYDGGGTLSSEVISILNNDQLGFTITTTLVSKYNPTRNYYEFGGWYTDKECTDDHFATNKIIYESTILYAKWTPIVYNIDYSLDNFDNCDSDGLEYDSSSLPESYTVVSDILLPTNLERTGYKFDGWYTDPEFTNKITHINLSTITNIGDIIIYGLWTDPNARTITFKYHANSPVDGITDSEEDVVSNRVATYLLLNYNNNELVINSNKYFEGWYVDESCLIKFDVATHINDSITEINLYAKWLNKYTVEISVNGVIVESLNIIEGNKLSKPTDPTLQGYNFTGWYSDANYTTVWNFDSNTVIDNMTLYAKFEQITYTISYNSNGGSGSMSSANVNYGGSYTVLDNSFTRSGYTFTGWNTKSNGSGTSYSGGSTISNITENITLYAQWSQESSGGGTCLAEGTLITMADGTKKKVEDILPGDLLIVFNHETGKYETAEVLFNDSESINNYIVVNLEFSNGSVVRVIAEHGFFDLDLMKYVYIDEYNYMDYVGHRFVASTYVDGEVVQSIVTLDNAFLTEEYIRVYSPVTKYHMNYITEDILSMPGGVEGLFNIFEYDDNLQYNEEQMQKDIETYGLFTYEDFKDLVSYEVYCSFPAAYFKVALGKGILTWEDLEYYIARYAPLV